MFCARVNDNLKADSEANKQPIADRFYRQAVGTPPSIGPRHIAKITHHLKKREGVRVQRSAPNT
jgi:hypothetical protein